MKLFASLFITLAVGAIAGRATFSEIRNWYAGLIKPSFNPPNWIFGPVWTTLYVMMGVALFLVWRSSVKAETKRLAMTVFFVQLVLNFAWSFIFFRFHLIGWAFAEILLMWVMILLTIILFSRISKPAAWLLVPYIAWVSFASVLNFAIWRLNG
jgi:translocator protein